MRQLAVLALLPLALAACGGGGGGGGQRAALGEKVFADAGCGGCHTMSAAKSSGKVGPDLDGLKPDAGRVARQVELGGRGMPAFGDKLTENEIQAVAAYVADSTANSKASVPAAYTPDDTTLDDCDANFGCFEQAFANVSFRQGPQAALKLLERESATDDQIESDCHRITHAIGAGALEHYNGDPGKALAKGSTFCASGYYHGILERSLLGEPREAIGPITQEICSDKSITRSDFIHFQCVHGLGHGLMIYTGYELPTSLEYCDGLDTDWSRDSCYGGVFMENSQSSYGTKSQWLKDDDLLYPCDWVAAKHKYQCYLIQLAHIGPAVGFDWKKVSATCRQAEDDYIDVCFQSMGREISGQERHRSDDILADCSAAAAEERECIYGAARDVTYNDAGPARAKVLCNTAAKAFRAYCWEGIGTILGSLNRYAEEKEAACRKVTKTYYTACTKGANV